MKKIPAVLPAICLLLVAGAFAQDDAPPDRPAIAFFTQQIGPGPEPGAPGPVTAPLPPPGAKQIIYFSAGMIGDGKPVTGAPYSATALTEVTQTLSDGNRIVNKTTASLARDSMGRTRREQQMGALGPWKMKAPDLIFINDPVSQTDYVLNPADHTVRVMKPGAMPPLPPPPPGGTAMGAVVGGGPGGNFTFRTSGPPSDPAQVKKESLGTQVIAGVAADGTRETRTIPAGQIGNERPIQIVSETWLSPDLHVVVMSKRSDPRFGDTSYQLTNIQRQEPDPSLFQVPPSYTIQSGPPAPPRP